MQVATFKPARSCAQSPLVDAVILYGLMYHQRARGEIEGLAPPAPINHRQHAAIENLELCRRQINRLRAPITGYPHGSPEFAWNIGLGREPSPHDKVAAAGMIELNFEWAYPAKSVTIDVPQIHQRHTPHAKISGVHVSDTCVVSDDEIEAAVLFAHEREIAVVLFACPTKYQVGTKDDLDAISFVGYGATHLEQQTFGRVDDRRGVIFPRTRINCELDVEHLRHLRFQDGLRLGRVEGFASFALNATGCKDPRLPTHPDRPITINGPMAFCVLTNVSASNKPMDQRPILSGIINPVDWLPT